MIQHFNIIAKKEILLASLFYLLFFFKLHVSLHPFQTEGS